MYDQVLVLAAEKAADSWGVIFSFSHRTEEIIKDGKCGGEEEETNARCSEPNWARWLIDLPFL